MAASARGPSAHKPPLAPGLFPWRGMRFLGGSFLLAVVLLVAGLQVAGLPNLAFLGVLLLFCALQFAYLSPFLWNRLYQHLGFELGLTAARARRPRG